MAEKRISQVQRKTNETDISLSLNLDGNGKQNIPPELDFLTICYPVLPDMASLIWICR